MNYLTEIQPWQQEHLTTEYDIVICAVGYERRSRFIAENYNLIGEQRSAIAFPDRKIYNYDDNKRFYMENGFDVKEVSDAEFEQYCSGLIAEQYASGKKDLSIGLDISSLSRLRIAAVIAVMLAKCERNITLDCMYSNAAFVPAPRQATTITNAGPIHSRFAGWSEEPEKPCVAVFGLGYEPDKAVGTLEFLEPASTWAFQTFGPGDQFHREVDQANISFWNIIPDDRKITYDILKPYDCFVKLESLSYGSMQYARLVLIPFGPKIFTAVCLAVACVHYPRISVWRASSGKLEIPINRLPNGEIVGIRILFSGRYG